MITLELIGWKQGLPVVSLIEAIKLYSSNHSLVQAKQVAEDLLAGKIILLEFDSERRRDKFRQIGEKLGVIFQKING